MFQIKLSAKIFFYILFFYQLYDLFNDYFHYDYSIELSFYLYPATLPSVTICINKKYEISDGNQFGNQTIVCYHPKNRTQIFEDCNEEKVYLRYRHKEICLTFFNNKTQNYYKFQTECLGMMFISYKNTQQRVIIHPPDTPSHFEINNVFVSYGYQFTDFDIQTVNRLLLPKPYSTDCHDYSQYGVSSLSQRSQSYCMFEYMRKEELNKCGKNIYWNQYVIDTKKQMNYLKFKNQSSNECIVEFNFKLLSRLCKIDCIHSFYRIGHSKLYSGFVNPIADIPIKIQSNINLSYKPKLTMEQFCSNFGGIISMYFGLSMVNISSYIFAYILNIRWIKKIKIIIIIFKFIIKIIFHILMLYQLIMIIKLYIEENRQIKIFYTNEIKFNKISLFIEPLFDFKRNNEYYTQFQEKILNIQYGRIKIFQDHIYNVFLQNLTTFKYITRFSDIEIECSIQLRNNINMDCGEIILSKIINYGGLMRLLYNIPADNFINSTKFLDLKQILIKVILPNYDKYPDYGNSFHILIYNSIFTNYSPNDREWLSIYLNYMNTFIVEPTYYRRLTHFGQQCNPRVRPLFDDSLTDDCIIDCFQKRTFDKYNCIPFKRIEGFIRWKKDLIENNKILCNQSYSKEIILTTVISKCINECQFDCELGLYKFTKFYNYNPIYGNNIIPIKIIPRSNLIVQYEEVYVMDGWELIYQLGGVVGMWVGWSALSIAGFMNNIFVVPNNIKYKLKLLLNYFKYYFHKIKNITIKICILFNIYFLEFNGKFKIFFLTLIYQFDNELRKGIVWFSVTITSIFNNILFINKN